MKLFNMKVLSCSFLYNSIWTQFKLNFDLSISECLPGRRSWGARVPIRSWDPSHKSHGTRDSGTGPIDAFTRRKPRLWRHLGAVWAALSAQHEPGNVHLSLARKFSEKSLPRHLALRHHSRPADRVPERWLHQCKSRRHDHPRLRHY